MSRLRLLVYNALRAISIFKRFSFCVMRISAYIDLYELQRSSKNSCKNGAEIENYERTTTLETMSYRCTSLRIVSMRICKSLCIYPLTIATGSPLYLIASYVSAEFSNLTSLILSHFCPFDGAASVSSLRPLASSHLRVSQNRSVWFV